MTLKILFISTFCMLHSIKLFAQFSETFLYDEADSILWKGNVDDFELSEGFLQLVNTEAENQNQSVVCIEASTSLNEDTSWYFDWLMDFSPSASNYAVVWLSAEWNGEEFGDGYFLRMGGYSGDGDVLSLYKRMEGQNYLIGQSQEGYMHGDQSVFRRLKVYRTTEGYWQIFGTDELLGEMILLFDSWDASLQSGSHFGFDCRYTKTRNEHFFCDSIFIDPIYVDVSAPEIEDMEYVSAGHLALGFNEAISDDTMQIYLNEHTQIVDYALVGSLLLIDLSGHLDHGDSFKLSLEGLGDLSGNTNDYEIEGEFVFMDLADRGGFIITECYFHPDVSENPLGPTYEYIEFFNRSERPLDMADYSINLDGHLHFFDKKIIPPFSYVVISSDESVLQLGECAIYYPSLSQLPNTGGQIVLSQLAADKWIDQLDYSSSAYNDDERDDGGYSLERMDYQSICLGEQNWKASEDLSGCSPGRINSVVRDNSEVSLEMLATVDTDQTDFLLLSSNFYLSDSLSPEFFSVDPDLDIISVTKEYNNKSYAVLFDREMTPGQPYTLFLSSDLLDCKEDYLEWEGEILFGLGKEPKEGDIIINEIMCDPHVGCNSFIEFRITTDSILNSNAVFLEYSSDAKVYWYPIDLPSFQTSSYYAFMEDAQDLELCYPNLSADRIILTDNLRQMDRDSFALSLYYQKPDLSLSLLDRFTYKLSDRGVLADWRGKSYERLQTGLWKTAIGPDFSSPGCENQFFFINNLRSDEPFYLSHALLNTESSPLILHYDLKGGQGLLNSSFISFGHSQVHRMSEDKYLNGKGTIFYENLELQFLRNGFNMLFLELGVENGQVEYFRLPFYFMK